MTTMIKGICKGSFKYISHLFVVKEREMEIGFPTNVKHVAHIGWDVPDSHFPSWMNDFKSDSGLNSVGSIGGSRDLTWTSQDFEQSMGLQSSSAKLSNFSPSNMPSTPKKQKRKKIKSTSSPKSSSVSSFCSSKHKSVLGNREEGDSRLSANL